MKRKIMITMLLVIAMVVVTVVGCGIQASSTDVITDTGDSIVSPDTTETNENNTSPDVIGNKTNEDEKNNELNVTDTFEGSEDENFVLYSEEYENMNYKGLDTLQYNKYEVTIVAEEEIIVYNGNGNDIGCVKKGGTINIAEADSNGDWTRFLNPFPESEYDYLYMLKTYVNAYAVGEPKVSPVANEVPVETAKTDTPKNETPEIKVPVEESTSVPTQAEPVVEENEKYTPEEAIAIYRSIMESNGMIWDPSIKEFASWGTGIVYLGKGYLEQEVPSDLEAMAYGDGTGTSFYHYYFEITGYDENYMYTKAWVCP